MNRMPKLPELEDISGGMYLNGGEVDRAVGAVVGSAVGDALGAYYETTYPRFDEEIVMRPGGGFDHRRALGAWTDDTAMALGILDALAAGHPDSGTQNRGPGQDNVPGTPTPHWDPPPICVTDMAANFLAWYRSGPPDVGNQTAAILDAAAGADDVAEVARRYTERNRRSAGNGALMRTTAVALGQYVPDPGLATGVAALTHPHPDSVDACVVWSLTVHQAIYRQHPFGPDSEEVDDTHHSPFDVAKAVQAALGHISDETRRRRWERLVDEVLDTPDIITARSRFCPNGWVVTAFQAALWAILTTPQDSPEQHFHDALVTAVRIGHDTDTVAAIAGGLLGAHWGLDAIPSEWTRHLHGDRTRGDTVTGAELATIALRAFECTMHRWMRERAARWVGFG